MNDDKSITSMDWSSYAGEEPPRYHWNGGFACDEGQEVFRASENGARRGIQYRPDEQVLVIFGRKWKGRVRIDGETVVMEKTTKNRFEGHLPVDGFRRMLMRLRDSEMSHRDAQIKYLNDIQLGA